MKLGVVGSREFPDKQLVFKELDEIHKKTPITKVISGGAKGVDSWSIEWAKQNNIDWQEYKADWNDLSHPDAVIRVNKMGQKYDALAGHRRNTTIVNESEKVIAFSYKNSGGTNNTIGKAKKQNKILKVIKV